MKISSTTDAVLLKSLPVTLTTFSTFVCYLLEKSPKLNKPSPSVIHPRVLSISLCLTPVGIAV